jgi:PiT family inorganic phosphate transporter
LYSLGHGGNDAQKTMGIIAVLLFSQGYLGNTFHVPFWVVITCQAAMGLGTLIGGWRIVHTMARKVSAVRWNVASNIVLAWIITLPAAALIGGLFYWLARMLS